MTRVPRELESAVRLSKQFPDGFVRVALLLSVALGTGSCRRHSLGPRGDAAAVVVAPHKPAVKAGPPHVLELEPNDKPEQAQALVFNPEWPVLSVEGVLLGPGGPTAKDVDVYKLKVPQVRPEPAEPQLTVDSAQSEDPRMSARRLAMEIGCEGEGGAVLQFLDSGLGLLASVSAEAGDVRGMPNLALSSDHAYFVRVSYLGKRDKAGASAGGECKYRLTLQLGDFELTDEREPNDGMATANGVPMVGTAELAGFHGWFRDQDFFRIPAPEVASALEVILDAVDGVSPGLQVLDANGARLAAGKGTKGERLALRNVSVPAASPDTQSFYVVVRSEGGQNRDQRYVLHLSLGAPASGFELEPNDDPGRANEVRDGEVRGYLPIGDQDCFRYVSEAEGEVSISVSWPARVRGKIEVTRQEDGQTVASARAKKPRQTLVLPKLAVRHEALLLCLGPGQGEGNASEAYALTVASVRPIR